MKKAIQRFNATHYITQYFIGRNAMKALTTRQLERIIRRAFQVVFDSKTTRVNRQSAHATLFAMSEELYDRRYYRRPND